MKTFSTSLALAFSLACAPPCPAQQVELEVSYGDVPQKILSPDLEPGDIFAAAVAVDGDTMLLAAEYDDDNGTDSGSVWVYRYHKNAWVPVQKLKPMDAQTGDNFGRSVTLQGKVAVVGAHWDDDNGNQAGSVYIFQHNGSEWVQVQKLLAPDGAPNDRFGATLALHGKRLLVGSWLDDDKGGASGSVYSFHHNGSAWVFDQKLTASDGSGGDQFARYVAMSRGVALIGAWKDDAAGVDSGSAYIYRHTGTQWVEEQKLVPNDLGAGDLFGWATHMDKDVAIVGSYNDDDGAQNAGAVYVYRDTGSGWVMEQKVLADDAAAFNQFGYSIAVHGDTMLLGSKITQPSVNQVGKAYVFRRSGGVWTQRRLLEPPDGAAFDAYSFHLHMHANTFVVGAWRHEAGGVQAGAAYVWTDPGLSPSRAKK